MSKLFLKDILLALEMPFEVINSNDSIFVDTINPVSNAKETALSFVNKGRGDKAILIQNSKAAIIICDGESNVDAPKGKCLILVDNPKLAFSIVANKYFVNKQPYDIHPSAVIDNEAQIAKKVYIGANCVIGKVTIGEGTLVHPNVTIYDGAVIGNNVTIHAGAVIGAPGFGYSRKEDGQPVLFPHIGGVIVEDGVEIGANTCIDRGAMDNTIIKKNAKIDNLVHIAHNCIIGENAYVIANAMVGGSTRIGKNAYISPSVSLRDQLTIGDNTLIGMGAVVTKSVPSDETWAGVPAMPLDQYKELNNRLKKL